MRRSAIDIELRLLINMLRKQGATNDDLSGALAGALFDIKAEPYRNLKDSPNG